MKEVKSKGIRCLSEEPRIGAHNKPVLFLHVRLIYHLFIIFYTYHYISKMLFLINFDTA